MDDHHTITQRLSLSTLGTLGFLPYCGTHTAPQSHGAAACHATMQGAERQRHTAGQAAGYVYAPRQAHGMTHAHTRMVISTQLMPGWLMRQRGQHVCPLTGVQWRRHAPCRSGSQAGRLVAIHMQCALHNHGRCMQSTGAQAVQEPTCVRGRGDAATAAANHLPWPLKWPRL